MRSCPLTPTNQYILELFCFRLCWVKIFLASVIVIVILLVLLLLNLPRTTESTSADNSDSKKADPGILRSKLMAGRFSLKGEHDSNYEEYLRQLDVPNFLIELLLDSSRSSLTFEIVDNHIKVKTTIDHENFSGLIDQTEKFELDRNSTHDNGLSTFCQEKSNDTLICTRFKNGSSIFTSTLSFSNEELYFTSTLVESNLTTAKFFKRDIQP